MREKVRKCTRKFLAHDVDGSALNYDGYRIAVVERLNMKTR